MIIELSNPIAVEAVILAVKHLRLPLFREQRIVAERYTVSVEIVLSSQLPRFFAPIIIRAEIRESNGKSY